MLVVISSFLHVWTFFRAWRFVPIGMKVPGLGRITILSWASLELWVVIFLWLTLGILGIERITGHRTPVAVINTLNLFLVIYLIAQPLGVTVAVERYIRRERKEAEEAENARGLSVQGDRAEDDGAAVLG